MERVDSRAVRSMAYDRRTRWLFIAYRSERKSIYAYRNVTPAEWRMLHLAPSIARYVNARIKPRHEFVRIDQPEK